MNPGPAAAKTRRLGVFGGAFDPPHLAHVALAEAAVAQLRLDELRIIPTGQAWHKTRALSAAEHRLAMAQLAFGPLPGVVVDPRELRREGASYTIDTLQELAAEQPDSALFVVMGADQYAAFTRWHRWQDILRAATVCVADRPMPPSLASSEPSPSRPPASRVDPAPDDLLPGVQRLQLPLMALSATEIRQQLAANPGASAPWQQGVPEPVARYISLHRLYNDR